MSFKYRLKTYKDEEGEFSNYLPADKNLILGIIEAHWTDDSAVPNGLEIISIANGCGEHLVLEHFKKTVFDVYYLPVQESFHYHKKSRINIVFESLDLFFQNELVALEQSLNRTKKENKYIRGDFFYIDHNYRYNERRSIREGLWLLYALPMGLTLSGIGFGLFFVPSALVDFFGFFPFVMGFYFWLPGLLLHIQYKKDIGNLVVRVTRGQDRITLGESRKQREISKQDVKSVTKFENPAYRNPWSEYGYAEIEFKDGRIINITNILCDQVFILDKFSRDNIETKTVKKWLPKIARRTNV